MSQGVLTAVDAAYDGAVAALCARRGGRLGRGLERITPLVAALGEPARAYRAVHVTGTNGKTSLARMLAAVLAAHGRRTGCFTSPHLQDVRERVRIDGRPIDAPALLAALRRVDAHLDAVAATAGAPPTFFESITAAALSHFAAAHAEVAVLEVGRGGALDATNVVDGDVAVIGTVGLDHPELGATHGAVATEKAGLISPGAVAVCGPQRRDAGEAIAAVARARGATLRRWGCDIDVGGRVITGLGQRFTVRTPLGARLEVALPLRGAHQTVNAALAVAAAEAHLGELDPDAVAAALAGVHVPGRLEVVARPRGAAVWLDGAHNPSALRRLACVLAPVRAAGPVTAVLAVRGDKDAAAFAHALAPAVDALVVVPSPCPPPASPSRLLAAARATGRRAVAAGDVATALAAADRLGGPDGIVVVTGSLAAVGVARTELGLPPA